MGRVNLAQPLDPRRTPVNGFSAIDNSTGALINPDVFAPSRFLGPGRASGFRLRSNWASSTYHESAGEPAPPVPALLWNVSYKFSKYRDSDAR